MGRGAPVASPALPVSGPWAGEEEEGEPRDHEGSVLASTDTWIRRCRESGPGEGGGGLRRPRGGSRTAQTAPSGATLCAGDSLPWEPMQNNEGLTRGCAPGAERSDRESVRLTGRRGAPRECGEARPRARVPAGRWRAGAGGSVRRLRPPPASSRPSRVPLERPGPPPPLSGARAGSPSPDATATAPPQTGSRPFRPGGVPLASVASPGLRRRGPGARSQPRASSGRAQAGRGRRALTAGPRLALPSAGPGDPRPRSAAAGRVQRDGWASEGGAWSMTGGRRAACSRMGECQAMGSETGAPPVSWSVTD